VFPEGLAPLSDKIDELIERTLRAADPYTARKPATSHGGRAGSPTNRARPLSPAQAGTLRSLLRPASPSSPGGAEGGGASGGGGWAASPRVGALSGAGAGEFSSPTSLASPGRMPNSNLNGGMGGGGIPLYARSNLTSAGGGAGMAGGVMGTQQRPWTSGGPVVRGGALSAAGMLWERSQEITHAPAMRQCLTWEEVQTLKL
jgi:hypothetical protein